MSIYRNPMSRGKTLKQKTSFFFWLLFTIASVFCAAQSIDKSVHIHRGISYAVALAIIAGATLCLYLVKRSADEGFVPARSLKLVSGFTGFLFFWFFIVMANTHYVYFMMSSERIRLNELTTVKKNFYLVKKMATDEVETFCADYIKSVENEIDNLNAEIVNPNNPGHHTAADSILRRIEALVLNPVDLPSKPPLTWTGLRAYADSIAAKIRRIRDQSLLPCYAKKNEIDSLFSSGESAKISEAITANIESFDLTPEMVRRNVLRNSYALFDKICKAIADITIQLGGKKLTLDVTKYKLSSSPLSIEIEDIATAWKYFFKSPDPRFWWSLLLAVIIDIASFLFWYFGVLSREDD